MEGGKEDSEKEMEDDVVKKFFSKEALEKDYALIKQWREAVKDSPQTEFTQKIGARIVELIKRDPLSKELTKAIEKSLLSLREIRYHFPKIPELLDSEGGCITVDGFSLVYIYEDRSDIPEDIRKLAKNIGKKWYCDIHTTIHKPLDKEDSLVFGTYPVTSLWCAKFNILSPVETPIMQVNNAWPLNDVKFDRSPLASSVYSPRDKLPFFINLAVIDNSDISRINKIVREVVKQRLKEFRSSSAYGQPPTGYPTAFHDKDLMFLYHIKDDTFERYIRWYDIHMQEHLGFRIIAFIENESKGNRVKAGELLEKIKNMTNRPKVGRFIERKNKVEVKGEDKVEKGIKLIYQAIYRKYYDRKNMEPMMDVYDCPYHGGDCSSSCSYYQNWLERFNRAFPSS